MSKKEESFFYEPIESHFKIKHVIRLPNGVSVAYCDNETRARFITDALNELGTEWINRWAWPPSSDAENK